MLKPARPTQLPPDPVLVRLLDGFGVEVDRRQVALPVHAQRVIAYLALQRPSGTSQRRTALAERLWSECPHARAQASLRTSIWRIRQADRRLVHADRDRVRLGALVQVDVQRSLEQAERLLAGDGELRQGDATITGLVADLLPGWEDEWLVLERERIRQVRIHALEALAHRLLGLGRLVPALDAAYAAIAAEPLRESAHAALVDIHLARGNIVEARRQVDQYATLLWAEMRLTPSDSLISKVPGARRSGGTTSRLVGHDVEMVESRRR